MLKRLYGAFTKITKNDDGTLEVEGIASSEAVDSDGEIIKADAMKAAIPGYMKFGAVREMHSSIAAGTALSCEVNDEGQTILRCLVVDPVSVKKVETKVLKGFSIGGKVTGRDTVNKATIVGLELVEISLVDRPANPDAVITCFKAENITDPDIAEELAKTEVIEARTVGKTLEELRKSQMDAKVSIAADMAAAAKAAEAEVQAVDAIADALTKGDISATLLVELLAKHKAATAPVKKGLYGVSVFADVLCSIGYLAASAGNEADWEGDNSPVPGQLRDWVASGAKIFVSMATEEANELVAELRTAAGEVDLIEMAAKSGIDLTKAGAKFSAKSKEVLGQVHKAMGDAQTALEKHGAAMKDCCDKMDSLGYVNAEEPEKATGAPTVKNEPAAPAEAQAAAGDPKEAAAGIDLTSDNLTIGELVVGTILKGKQEAAAAAAPAAAPAPVAPQKPALMVVDKSGAATPLGGQQADASTDATAMIKTALRGAFGY